MLEYEKIIDKMAIALFEMFNGATNGLTVDHFKMVAANGLFTAMETHSSPKPGFNTLYGYFENKYSGLSTIMKSKKLSLGWY